MIAAPAQRILVGDVLDKLAELPDGCVQSVVTSPPYWGLRDYGTDSQIGLEHTPDAYISKMVAVFREVRRVLRDDGTLWLNIGDSYQQRKPKDLCMIPWRLSLALQADGWWIRSVIAWCKKSPMPESATDRPTSSWEPIFLMTKAATYFYDATAVMEHAEYGGYKDARAFNGKWASDVDEPRWDGRGISGRNQRNVWHLGPEPFHDAHFATFPTAIPRRAILAGTSEKGCCPTCGAPWRRIVASCDNTVVGVGVDVDVRTTGWYPTCACDGLPEAIRPALELAKAITAVPCTVLDPFLGSGTTLAVAAQLGRAGIGIELNPAYAKMAERRIGEAARPSTYRDESREIYAPLFENAIESRFAE